MIQARFVTRCTIGAAAAMALVLLFAETASAQIVPEHEIPLRTYGMYPLGFDPNTNRIYVPVSSWPGGVAIINGVTDTVVGTLVLESGGTSGIGIAVAVDSPAQRVYVSTWYHLWVFNKQTHVVQEVIPLVDPQNPGNSEGGAVAVNTVTGHVYVQSLNRRLWIIDPLLPAGDPARITTIEIPLATAGCGEFRYYGAGLTFNPSTQLLYIATKCNGIVVLDTDPSRPTFHSIIGSIAGGGPVAVNRLTNRVYAVANPESTPLREVIVVEGDRVKPQFNSVIAHITIPYQPYIVPFLPDSFSIDAGRGRLYAWVGSWATGDLLIPALSTIDLSTNAVVFNWPLGERQRVEGQVLVNPATHRVYMVGHESLDKIEVFLDVPPSSTNISIGSPVAAQVGTTSLTFATVASGGTTTVQSIDPAASNLQLPGQFSLAGAGYEISTTANVSGAITVCFDMSAVADPDAFSALRVLHGEGSAWVDRTLSNNFSTGQVCASVSSLSPFAIATLNAQYQIEKVFDATKAFQQGRTIPIKLRLLNDAGQNVSSPLIAMSAKRLVRVSDSSSAAIQDPGNANPDLNFRYDAALGGYVFNLSTKGIVPGTYGLRLRAAGDPSLHEIQFQIR